MPPSPDLILHPLSGTTQWRVRTLRNEGKPIPRWVWASKEEEAPVGILTIDVEQSVVYNRKLKLATLRGEHKDLLPPLRDVTIIRMLHGDLTIAGGAIKEAPQRRPQSGSPHQRTGCMQRRRVTPRAAMPRPNTASADGSGTTDAASGVTSSRLELERRNSSSVSVPEKSENRL